MYCSLSLSLPLSDMAVPALARFGSHELKNNFLAPSISGDFVACVGVSEPGAGSDVANIRTSARPKKGREEREGEREGEIEGGREGGRGRG